MTFNTRALGIQAGWQLKESGWKEGMDRNLTILAALARGVIEAADITDYPTAPLGGFKPGDMYTIATNSEGWGHPDMETHRRELLIRTESGWEFMVPEGGMSVRDAVNLTWYTYADGYFGWVATERPGNNIAAIIDMEDQDYSMSKGQAEAPFKIVINAQPGKVLLWPASAIKTMPAIQNILVLYSREGFILRQEGADLLSDFDVPLTNIGLVIAPSPDPVFGLGILGLNQLNLSSRIINPLGDSVRPLDVGCILYSYGADPVDINLPTFSGVLDQGFKLTVIQVGLGKVTFVPEPGLTLLNPDNYTSTRGPGSVVTLTGGGDNQYVILSGDME